ATSASAIEPGRFLFVEHPAFRPSDDRFDDDVAEAWVGVEDATGAHRFWSLAQVAFGEDDDGDARVVGSADVTGDGIAEHLIEVTARRNSRPGMTQGVSSELAVAHVLWDPAGARTLARVDSGWGQFELAPPACDDWCIDGVATTEAEEAAFDCDACEDAGREGRRAVTLESGVLVIGEPRRVSGPASLQTDCPSGRFAWANAGWTAR
ncbi:MAG: hypothetical protein AAF602_22300, partial [Myxococcota bacterium]